MGLHALVYHEVYDDSPNRRRRIVPADTQASIGLATHVNILWSGKTCVFNHIALDFIMHLSNTQLASYGLTWFRYEYNGVGGNS